jgi:hypothetical protein
VASVAANPQETMLKSTALEVGIEFPLDMFGFYTTWW